MNSKQVLITASACIVAAIIFFFTMLAAPAPKRANNSSGGSTIIAIPGWEKTELGSGSGAPNMKGMEVHFNDNHGVQYDLLGESLTPKSQGVIDVIKPIARIHLKPNKTVVQISADEGTFITPTSETRTGMIGTVGQPTSGLLKGNVVIRLFENDGVTPIDLSDDSINEVLNLKMQQANFDRDLGQIEADGSVKLDGRDVAFEGENLNIIYSPLLQRINRLEIQKGKFIRIKNVDNTNSLKPADESNTPLDDDVTTEPKEQPKTDSDQSTEPQILKTPARPTSQYYHITLNDHIQIDAQKNQLLGDQLELYLGMANRQGKKSQDQENNNAKPTNESDENSNPQSTPAVVVAEEDDPDDDILIKWTGPMLMLPVDDKPEMLANVRDIYMQITGTPMKILPPSKDVITASSIDYLHSQSRVRVRSSTAYPLRIDSPQIGGLITGKHFEMFLDKGLGILQGEGNMHGLSRSVLSDAKANNATSDTINSDDKSLTPGTSIHWTDRVELVFYPENDDDEDVIKTNFDALKTITFRGDVEVEHDEFDVVSDLITVQMTKPTADKNKQEASIIEAAGDVSLRTHSTDPERQLALHANQANIHFVPNDTGKMIADKLTANDDVVIRRPGQVLWSDSLLVELGHGEPVVVAMSPQLPVEQIQSPDPVDALDTMLAWEDKEQPIPTVTSVKPDGTTNVVANADTPKTDDDKSDKIYLKKVTVEGDVRARMINKDQAVYAFAHRITGDDNQVELFGNDQRPTQVVQDSGILAGDHLVYTHKDQNLHVIGKGTLSYLSTPLDEKPQNVTIKPSVTKPQGNLNVQPVSELNVDGSTTTSSSNANGATNTKPAQTGDVTNQIAPSLPTLEPAKVRVQWQDNMHYNHQTLQALFMGDVVLTASRADGATTVKGDDIRVLFNKFTSGSSKPISALDTPNLPQVNDDGMVKVTSLQGGRQVRMVNIKGNAEFLEETWAPLAANATIDPDDRANRTLLTRLRIAGQTMDFDAVPETITIPGAGTLLHEDHRPKASSSNRSDDVQFTGRGQTLFRWKDQFMLDIAHNDMIMKDYVQMLHIPEDSDNGIQLDCRTFLADMEATGGLGTWLSGNPPTPDLKVVQASRDVRINAQNRQITTDRATYIHNVRKVKLQANENKLTRITTPSGTSSPGAELIVWELDTNRFYIARPGRMNEVAPRRR